MRKKSQKDENFTPQFHTLKAALSLQEAYWERAEIGVDNPRQPQLTALT